MLITYGNCFASVEVLAMVVDLKRVNRHHKSVNSLYGFLRHKYLDYFLDVMKTLIERIKKLFGYFFANNTGIEVVGTVSPMGCNEHPLKPACILDISPEIACNPKADNANEAIDM